MGYWTNFNAPATAEADKKNVKGELGELCDGKTYHLQNCHYFMNKYGDSGSFEVAEVEGKFYFANAPLARIFKQAQADDELKNISQQGIKFEKRHAEKYNLDYICPVFVEDVPF